MWHSFIGISICAVLEVGVRLAEHSSCSFFAGAAGVGSTAVDATTDAWPSLAAAKAMMMASEDADCVGSTGAGAASLVSSSTSCATCAAHLKQSLHTRQHSSQHIGQPLSAAGDSCSYNQMNCGPDRLPACLHARSLARVCRSPLCMYYRQDRCMAFSPYVQFDGESQEDVSGSWHWYKHDTFLSVCIHLVHCTYIVHTHNTSTDTFACSQQNSLLRIKHPAHRHFVHSTGQRVLVSWTGYETVIAAGPSSCCH